MGYRLHNSLEFQELDAKRLFKQYLLRNRKDPPADWDPTNIYHPASIQFFNKPEIKARIEDFKKNNKIEPLDATNFVNANTPGCVQYGNFGTFAAAQEGWFKAQVKQRLQQLFRYKENKHVVLVLSGHGGQDGAFYLNGKLRVKISLAEIVEEWDRHARPGDGRPPGWRMHLLIIVDSCFSGMLVSQLENRQILREFNDISIQASSQPSEVSNEYATYFGGVFINNFLIANGYKSAKYRKMYCDVGDVRYSKQTPCFYSRNGRALDQYGLKVGFNGWSEIEALADCTYEGRFVGKKEDFKGRMDSVLLMCEGQKEISLENSKWVLLKGQFKLDRLIQKTASLISPGLTCHWNSAGELFISKNDFEVAKQINYEGFSDFHQNSPELVSLPGQVSLISNQNKNFNFRDSNDYRRTKHVYFTGDWSVGSYRNGLRHGLTFLFKMDGGFTVSQYHNERLMFEYAVNAAGQLNIRIHETLVISYDKKLQPFAADKYVSFAGKIKNKLEELAKAGQVVRKNAQSATFESMTYTGSLRGELPHGQGVLSDENGVVLYDGGWINGLRHGKGKGLLPDGSTYEGEWRIDHVFGVGTQASRTRVIQGLQFRPTVPNAASVIHYEKSAWKILDNTSLDLNLIDGLYGFLDIKAPTPSAQFPSDIAEFKDTSLMNLVRLQGEFFMGKLHGQCKLAYDPNDPSKTLTGEFFENFLLFFNLDFNGKSELAPKDYIEKLFGPPTKGVFYNADGGFILKEKADPAQPSSWKLNFLHNQLRQISQLEANFGTHKQDSKVVEDKPDRTSMPVKFPLIPSNVPKTEAKPDMSTDFYRGVRLSDNLPNPQPDDKDLTGLTKKP